jgi:hypothetical protein
MKRHWIEARTLAQLLKGVYPSKEYKLPTKEELKELIDKMELNMVLYGKW